MNALSQHEVAQFQRDGFFVARGLVPRADCAALKSAAQSDLAAVKPPVEYEADTKYPGAPASHEAPGGRTVRRLLQAYARGALFARWGAGPEIGSRLKQLLGPRVQLSQAHHNCVMTKNPRYSSLTQWHQDIRYWSFERPELISVWIALGREFVENGCLLVLPGTHVMDISPQRFDAALFLRPEDASNRELIATEHRVELDVGDVLFFHCRLFHAAGSNQTAETKFSLVFTYHAADNRPLAGTRSAGLADVAL